MPPMYIKNVKRQSKPFRILYERTDLNYENELQQMVLQTA